MTSLLRARARVVLVMLLISAAATEAQAPRARAVAREMSVIESWQARFRLAEEMLRERQWKKARNVADRLVYDAVQSIQGGPDSARFLADVVLVRALAEMGSDNVDDAIWDYLVAVALYPAHASLDLSPYDPAGTALRAAVGSGEEVEEALEQDEGEPLSDATAGEAEDVVVPPQKLSAPEPPYPLGKSLACVDGPVRIRAIIDEAGFVRRPALAESYDPVLGLMALETVRNWRFAPARLDGVPVAVFFRLTVNFELPRCPGG